MNITTNDLRLLIEGCRKHLPYRGLREPSGNCEICLQIFHARQHFEKIKDEPYLVLTYIAPEPDTSPFTTAKEESTSLATTLYFGPVEVLCNYCAKDSAHTVDQHVREVTQNRRR